MGRGPLPPIPLFPRRDDHSGPSRACLDLPPVELGVADTLSPIECSQRWPLVDQGCGELLGTLGQGSVVTRDQTCPGMGRGWSGWPGEGAEVGKGVLSKG